LKYACPVAVTDRAPRKIAQLIGARCWGKPRVMSAGSEASTAIIASQCGQLAIRSQQTKTTGADTVAG
jgi:hypothetical protein